MRITVSKAKALGVGGNVKPDGDLGKPRKRRGCARRIEHGGKPEPDTPVRVRVPGTPVAKSRHRDDGRTGAKYTPDKTRAYAKRVEEAGACAMRGRAPMTGPVAVEVVVALRPPGSWSARKRERALTGDVRPTIGPDVDNFTKNMLDALNGIVYVDDAQIVQETTSKIYSETASVEMVFRPLAAEPAYRR